MEATCQTGVVNVCATDAKGGNGLMAVGPTSGFEVQASRAIGLKLCLVEDNSEVSTYLMLGRSAGMKNRPRC